MNEYSPDIVTHPGIMLREKLQELGISPHDLSHSAGIEIGHVEGVIAGTAGIDEYLAFKLEDELGIPARLWLKYQSFYNQLGSSKE